MSSFNDNIIVKLHNYTYSYRYIGSMRIIKKIHHVQIFEWLMLLTFYSTTTFLLLELECAMLYVFNTLTEISKGQMTHKKKETTCDYT